VAFPSACTAAGRRAAHAHGRSLLPLLPLLPPPLLLPLLLLRNKPLLPLLPLSLSVPCHRSPYARRMAASSIVTSVSSRDHPESRA
jgi:hypothetical protein